MRHTNRMKCRPISLRMVCEVAQPIKEVSMNSDPRNAGKPKSMKPATVKDPSARMRAVSGIVFKSGRKLGYFVIGTAVISGIMLVIVAMFAPRRTATTTVESTFFLLLMFGGLIGVASVWGFTIWLKQVHRNLLALGNAELRWSTDAMSWISWKRWVLPRILRHYMAISEIWNGSDPRALQEDHETPQIPSLVFAFGVCFVVWAFLGLALIVAAATKSVDLTGIVWAMLFVWLVIYSLCIVLVLKINGMQARRYALIKEMRAQSDFLPIASTADDSCGTADDDRSESMTFRSCHHVVLATGRMTRYSRHG